MKKIFSLLIVAMITISASAQKSIEQSNIFDNVSMTIKGGATSPLSNPDESIRGVVGVELEKKITPIFGMGIEGDFAINTSKWINRKSDYVFDHQYIGVFTTTNWMNLLCGYKGSRRFFEIESNLGVGWGHTYTNGADYNYVATKAGLNFNFNPNESWTFSLKPAVVYNMNDGVNSNYNINRGALQVQVGVTYHFEGPSESRNFIICNKVATQSDMDNLNRTINGLREQAERDRAEYLKQISGLIEANKELSESLRKCESREMVVNNQIITPIQFKQGSCDLTTSEASLKAIAKVIKESNQSYVVVGYASEEGSYEFNKKLSEDRASAVVSVLIKYGAPYNKLTAIGMGETSEFSQSPELNRIVIINKQ